MARRCSLSNLRTRQLLCIHPVNLYRRTRQTIQYQRWLIRQSLLRLRIMDRLNHLGMRLFFLLNSMHTFVYRLIRVNLVDLPIDWSRPMFDYIFAVELLLHLLLTWFQTDLFLWKVIQCVSIKKTFKVIQKNQLIFEEKTVDLLSASIDPHPVMINSLFSGGSCGSVWMHAGRARSLKSIVPSNSINAISFFFRENE